VETIKNQMIIIEPTNRNEIAFGFGLYYNESHNNNISSPIRLNERIAIPFYSNGGMTFDYVSETVFIHNVKLTFDNTNHRLKYYRGMNRINSDLEYDDFGRLINVYQVVDDKKILRKAIYYDGILRHIEKPYYIEPYPELSNTPPDFIDQHSKGLEEIVIYDDRILKYVVHLHRRDNRMIDRRGISTPEQLKQLEQYLFLITYEYDDNLNLTKETRIYDEDFKELKGDNYIR
jgi:hypothetical protein